MLQPQEPVLGQARLTKEVPVSCMAEPAAELVRVARSTEVVTGERKQTEPGPRCTVDVESASAWVKCVTLHEAAALAIYNPALKTSLRPLRPELADSPATAFLPTGVHSVRRGRVRPVSRHVQRDFGSNSDCHFFIQPQKPSGFSSFTNSALRPHKSYDSLQYKGLGKNGTGNASSWAG